MKTEEQQALHRRSLRNDVILWARALAWKGKKRANPPPEPEEPSEGLIRIAWVTSVVFGGNHHVDTPTRMFGGPGRAFAAFRLHGTIASWDFNEMTRLTIAAHEAAVRVEVAVGGFRQLEIILHARERQGGMASRHPTMEEAIGLVKSWRWSDCPVPVPAGDDPGSNMDRAPVEA